MSAQIGPRFELVHGDMLEGPSDLVVIPCSTVPTITQFVRDRLRAVSIPIPQQRMALGQVEFLSLVAASNIAPMAAYAASVSGHSSTPDAIALIGRALGQFVSKHPWAQRIACPLLGTGAGGLSPEISVEQVVAGFTATAPRGIDALLSIHILDRALHERLSSKLASESISVATRPTGAERAPVRVFVSYTKTDDNHANWVKDLATYLRANGINSRLDVWHLRPGMDLTQWMCNEIDQADRVLLICNELYAARADGRHGGVGWEIRLVQGDLLQSQSDNPSKYVPVIVAADAAAAKPAFLKTAYCIDWKFPVGGDEAALRTALVRILSDEFEEEPPLGKPPARD